MRFTRRVKAWRDRRHAARVYPIQARRRDTVLAGYPALNDPGDRATLLFRAATLSQGMHDWYLTAYGVTMRPGEKRSMAGSLLWEATLLRTVGEVEFAAARRSARRPALGEIEDVAGPLLDIMAATPSASDRDRMLPDLAVAVTPIAGHGAAGILLALTGQDRAVTR